MTALILAVFLAPFAAQTASTFKDLAAELAETLAARLTPSEQINVIVAGGDAAETAQRREIRDTIVGALRARGVRLTDTPEAATRVEVTCGANLRERACLAEVRKGDAWDVVAASRLWTDDVRGQRNPPVGLSLEMRPIFAQHDPILDIALTADRLLVLEPAAIDGYERRAAGWNTVQSRPIAPTRRWPRDVRGRLWIDDAAVEVRLPGITCHAAVDLGNLTCVEERQAWPLGIENAGLDATRNYFTTPEGLPFFAAAAVGSGSDTRWLVADQSGVLALLDGARRVVARSESGDDLVALTVPCAPGAHVLVASSSVRRRDTETLRLLRVVGNQLMPAAAPIEVAGTVTALWSTRGTAIATVVVRDAGGERYEAFHVSIACNR